MSLSSRFVTLGRQQFRKYFQPSRIVLCVLPGPTSSGYNVLTLCFDMHCAYKPPMMAIAIQNTCASYDLIKQTEEYVLSVPGPSLAYETLFCGVKSMREVDKIGALNLELCASQEISVPGLAKAIANIELLKETLLDMGDHVLVVGRVVRFGVNTKSRELPLLSLGPDTRGYKVLVRKGIHRIGVVARGDAGRA